MKSRKVEWLNGLLKFRCKATNCTYSLIHLFTYSLFFTVCCLLFTPAFAQETILQGGVSIDKVPKEFYGNWRVSSNLVSTNNEEVFKKTSVDLWNLSRKNDVITLENPFSGANASITIDEIKGNFIKFKKMGNYEKQKLTDIVKITLSKESFVGLNELKLDTISEIDGYVIKTQWAVYKLKGEKISGESIK